MVLFVFSLFELVTVHTTSHLLGDLFDLAGVVGLDHYSESVDEALLWVVEIGQLDWEIECVDQLVGFCFYSLGQVDKVLVHYKCFRSVIGVQSGEPFEDLRYVHVVDFVHLDQVLEKHKDQVGKQS